MQETMICSDGKRRKAVRIICQNCGIETLTRIKKDKTYQFCSQKCSAEFKTSLRVDLVCATCQKQFTKTQSKLLNSKSGFHFCSRKCKDKAQRLGGIKEIMPPHYGTSETIDYRALFTEDELVCSRCGYDECKSVVDIHHIDENRTNNDKSNLIPLCSNCHRSLHFGFWKLDNKDE